MDIEEVRRTLRDARSEAGRAASDAEYAAGLAEVAADKILNALDMLSNAPPAPTVGPTDDGRDPLTDAEILWTQCGYHVMPAGARWMVLSGPFGQPVGEYGTLTEAQYVAYGCAMFGRPEQRP